KGAVTGELKLQLPQGWKSEPAAMPFTLTSSGEEQLKSFRVTPSRKEMTGIIRAEAVVEGKTYSQALELIEYDHIPTQTLMPPAQAKAVRIDMKKEGQLVAYIKGAGDEIPASLKNMGYDVLELKEEEVVLSNLQRADAVVLGVRALNTIP